MVNLIEKYVAGWVFLGKNIFSWQKYNIQQYSPFFRQKVVIHCKTLGKIVNIGIWVCFSTNIGGWVGGTMNKIRCFENLCYLLRTKEDKGLGIS